MSTCHPNEAKYILKGKHLPKHSKCIVFLNIDLVQDTFKKPCAKLIYAFKLENWNEVTGITFKTKEATKHSKLDA